LLKNKCNIAVSHSTFGNSTEETIELLKQGNYTLILDEVLDVVNEFKGIAVSKNLKEDIKLLMNEGFIEIDEFDRVNWIGNSYDRGGVFSEIEKTAKRGNLLLINDTLFLWEFPVDVFKSFEEVLILTYMFDGSFLKYYLQYNELEYELCSVERIEDSKIREYRLCGYNDDKSERHICKSKINIWDNPRIKKYTLKCFTSTWFKNNIKENSPETKTIKNNLRSFFRYANESSEETATQAEMMWTCVLGTDEEYKNLLQGDGYTTARRLSKEEKKLPKDEQDALKKSLSCFVPCNAKASNDYHKRFVLAYICNMFPNPYIVKFFQKKGVNVDQDAYALSCLIQWV
jgi:hypothetical protein